MAELSIDRTENKKQWIQSPEREISNSVTQKQACDQIQIKRNPFMICESFNIAVLLRKRFLVQRHSSRRFKSFSLV